MLIKLKLLIKATLSPTIYDRLIISRLKTLIRQERRELLNEDCTVPDNS